MHNRQKNKSFFSMIEILLAIGILAIGFSAVLGLFPVSIKMVRGSQTETLVADAVGDLQTYYYSWANIPLVDSSGNQIDGEYWYARLFYFLYTTAPNIPVPSPIYKFFVDGDIDDARDQAISGSTNLHGPTFLENLKKEVVKVGYNIDKLTVPKFGLIKNLNLFNPELTGNIQTNDRQTFYLINGENEFRGISSTAQLLVWISKMNKFGTLDEIDYKYGVVLNIEASWPINVPYDEREKRFYEFIIANPKQIN